MRQPIKSAKDLGFLERMHALCACVDLVNVPGALRVSCFKESNIICQEQGSLTNEIELIYVKRGCSQSVMKFAPIFRVNTLHSLVVD